MARIDTDIARKLGHLFSISLYDGTTGEIVDRSVLADLSPQVAVVPQDPPARALVPYPDRRRSRIDIIIVGDTDAWAETIAESVYAYFEDLIFTSSSSVQLDNFQATIHLMDGGYIQRPFPIVGQTKSHYVVRLFVQYSPIAATVLSPAATLTLAGAGSVDADLPIIPVSTLAGAGTITAALSVS